MVESLVAEIIEAIPFPVFVIDTADHSITVANSATNYGNVSNEVLHCYEATHGRSKPCSAFGERCPVEMIRETGKPQTVDHIHTYNGTKRYVRIFAYPMFDENGKPARILEIHTDITREINGAKRLAHRLQKYQTLSTAALEGIVLTKNGEIIDANKSAEILLKEPVKNLVGRKFSRYLPARSRLIYNRNIQQTTVTSFSTYLARQGEAALPVEIQCKPFSGDNETLQITAIRDRSLQLSCERKTKEREQILTDLFADAPIGISIVQPSGHLYYWNNAFELLTEYSERQLKRLLFRDLICAEELIPFLSFFDKLNGRSWKNAKGKTRFVTRYGDQLDIDIQATRVGTKSNPLFVFFVQDISAQVKLENMQKELTQKIAQVYRDMELITAETDKGGDFEPKMPNFGLSELDNTIVDYLTRGLTNREIANRVRLAEITVKKHVSSIYKAFNVSKRIDLINLLATETSIPESERSLKRIISSNNSNR